MTKTYLDYWHEGRPTIMGDKTVDLEVLRARINYSPKEKRSRSKEKQAGNWLHGYITALSEAGLLSADEFRTYFNLICAIYQI